MTTLRQIIVRKMTEAGEPPHEIERVVRKSERKYPDAMDVPLDDDTRLKCELVFTLVGFFVQHHRPDPRRN